MTTLLVVTVDNRMTLTIVKVANYEYLVGVAREKPGRARDRREKRVRRTPEEARTLILDAADSVFREHLPDVVGLKDVARAAGVSHALVTHYFGTYAGLVAACSRRRARWARCSRRTGVRSPRTRSIR
jgi:AcrR family transcriptional regulator